MATLTVTISTFFDNDRIKLIFFGGNYSPEPERLYFINPNQQGKKKLTSQSGELFVECWID